MILRSVFNKVRTFVSRSSEDRTAEMQGGENISDGGCDRASRPGAGFSYSSAGDCDFLFIPPSEIVRGSADMISELADAIGLTPAQSSEFLEPLVLSYASYVHLLPASERNHHRTPGGLFRHGLETSLLSVQMSRGLVLDYSGSVKQKREMEIRWRAGYAVAGLIHDAGKPVSDILVRTADGSATWNPFLEPLYEWGKTIDGDRYYLDWQTGRFRRHEHLNLLVLDLVLTRKIRGFLAPDFSREILCSLYNMVTGNYFASSLSRIVTLADQESAKRDLMSARLDASDLSTCIPAERYILEAIIRLMDTGVWTVNQPGARVWVLDSGTYVNWRCAGNIKEILDQAQIPAIPHSPDEMAMILLERGYAEYCISEREDGEPIQMKFFRIMPDIPGTVEMEALRLTEGAFIFPRVMPPAIRDLLYSGKSGSDAPGEGSEASGDIGIREKARVPVQSGGVLKQHSEEKESSDGTAPEQGFNSDPVSSGDFSRTDAPESLSSSGSETVSESEKQDADCETGADPGWKKEKTVTKNEEPADEEYLKRRTGGRTDSISPEFFAPEKKKAEDPEPGEKGMNSAAGRMAGALPETDTVNTFEAYAKKELKSEQTELTADAGVQTKTETAEKSPGVFVSLKELAPDQSFRKIAEALPIEGNSAGGEFAGKNSGSSGRKSGSIIPGNCEVTQKNEGKQAGDLKKKHTAKHKTEKVLSTASVGMKVQESASVSVSVSVSDAENNAEQPQLLQDDGSIYGLQEIEDTGKSEKDPDSQLEKGGDSERSNETVFEKSCGFRGNEQTSAASSDESKISECSNSSECSAPGGCSQTVSCEINSGILDIEEKQKLNQKQRETLKQKQKHEQNKKRTSAFLLPSVSASPENFGDDEKSGSGDFLMSRDPGSCEAENGQAAQNSEVSERSRSLKTGTSDGSAGKTLKRKNQGDAEEPESTEAHGQQKIKSGEKSADKNSASGQVQNSSVLKKNLPESRIAEVRSDSENSVSRTSKQSLNLSSGTDADRKLQDRAEEKNLSAAHRNPLPEISGVKKPAFTGPGSDFLFEQICLLDQGRKIPGFASNTRRIIIIGGLLFRENTELYAHFTSERISEQRQGELLKVNLRWSRYIEAVMKRAGTDPVRLPFNIMSSLKISSSLSFLSPDSCQRGLTQAGRDASFGTAGKSSPLNSVIVSGASSAAGYYPSPVSSDNRSYVPGRAEEYATAGVSSDSEHSAAGNNFSSAGIRAKDGMTGAAGDGGSFPAGAFLEKILKKYSGGNFSSSADSSGSEGGEKTVSSLTGKYACFFPSSARKRSAEEEKYLQCIDELNGSDSEPVISVSDTDSVSDRTSVSPECEFPDQKTAGDEVEAELMSSVSEEIMGIGAGNSRKSSSGSSKGKASSAGRKTGTKSSSSSRYSARKKAQAEELARINLCLEDLAQKLRSGFFKNATVTARGVETDLQSFFMFVDEFWKDLEHFTVLSYLGMKTVPAGPMFAYRLGNVILKSDCSEV